MFIQYLSTESGVIKVDTFFSCLTGKINTFGCTHYCTYIEYKAHKLLIIMLNLVKEFQNSSSISIQNFS